VRSGFATWCRETGASLYANKAQFWWQLVTAVFVLAYLASLFAIKRPHSGYISSWDGWMGGIASILPIVPIYLRVRSTSRLRGAWIAMGAGVVLYNAANLIYVFHDQNLTPVPSPAPSDVPYLLSYLAWAVGVVMMTQGSFGAVKASLRLDGAVTGLAIAAAAGMLWFDPVLSVSGRPLQVIVGMSYPLFDLVLLVLLVAGLAPLRYRPNLATLLLMLGVTAFVVGDIIYLNQVAADTYVGGTPLDGTWSIGIWLIGLAAWPREDRRLMPRQVSTAVPMGITLVPIFFGGISVAVLVTSLVHNTSKVTSLLALAALCLVIVRMGMTLRDVRVVEQENFRVARVDDLTGLRNRRAFFEDGGSRLLSLVDSHKLGIILIDLDGFKEINDSLGHACGDDLLRIVGSRFVARIHDRGVVSRLGGDEFACTCEIASLDEIVGIGEELVESLTDPISLDGVTVRVSASVGIAVSPEHGTTETELLRSADVAMYEAKESHSAVRVYRAEDDMNTRDRLAMIDDLRAAIEARALTLHFQPTLDLRTGSVRGVEALVRWRHPRFGLLYPEDFVPLAERVGLICSMTRLILELAVEQQARLDDAGHRLQMSVNISRFDLIDAGLPSFIVALLDRYGIEPSRLTLEVTESSLGEHPTRSSESIERLRERGIRISIDDFGVGYSSMSQLLELRVDELKIDKSFVLALGHDHRARAVIGATIDIARALKLTLVAEGIEDSATLKAVHDMGIDIAQGYFIACPFTQRQLDEFLMHPSTIVQRETGHPAKP
jgi:diguanylate cyclase (GGDEF)-like protein